MQSILLTYFLLISAIGCTSASTPNAAQSNQSVLPATNPTNAPLIIASETPVASPTPLPDVLAEMPIFGERDVAFTIGTFAFQVTDVHKVEAVDNKQAGAGKVFLIMEGRLFNFGENSQKFYRTNFEITLTDDTELLPDLDLMDKLQEVQYLDRDYPRRSSLPINALAVDARAWREIFVAYEVPATIEVFDMTFSPNDMQIPSEARLWLLNTGNDLVLYKATADDAPAYTIDFNFANTQIELEELIDTEVIEIDNCFGTAEISRTQTFQEEIISSYTLGDVAQDVGSNFLNPALEMGIQLLQLNPITALLLLTDFGTQNNVRSGDTITITRTENLSAAAGTKPRFQLSWYRVTIQGTMQLNIGGDNYYIPFTLTNRLRSELESLPPGECDQ